MKVTRKENLDQSKVVFEFDHTDIVVASIPGPLLFWQMVDKLAEQLKIPPFCPCQERPHRVFCPLGFEKYFPTGKCSVCGLNAETHSQRENLGVSTHSFVK